MTSGEVIGLELVAPDAVAKWRSCLGNTDPKNARPGTLRQLYGENIVQNTAHGCSSIEDAQKARISKSCSCKVWYKTWPVNCSYSSRTQNNIATIIVSAYFVDTEMGYLLPFYFDKMSILITFVILFVMLQMS